jgi:hypothetical protein
MFPGIGVLSGPATESHVVNSGTPEAPLDRNDTERKSHPRGKPLQPGFPKYHALFEEPHRPGRRAADDSLMAKAASTSSSAAHGTLRTYMVGF